MLGLGNRGGRGWGSPHPLSSTQSRTCKYTAVEHLQARKFHAVQGHGHSLISTSPQLARKAATKASACLRLCTATATSSQRTVLLPTQYSSRQQALRRTLQCTEGSLSQGMSSAQHLFFPDRPEPAPVAHVVKGPEDLEQRRAWECA